MSNEPFPPTIAWRDDGVAIIDQRRLPDELQVVVLRSVDELCDAITTLAVRGAPALGVAGAMGIALARATGLDEHAAAERLRATRPTAVNLARGVQRALAAADPVAEACRMADDDVRVNRETGAHGAALVADGAEVLTHCNTGSLATVGYGTALGVIRAAHEAGRSVHVWVDETRPLLQGARLTAWELARLGVAHTVVPDAAAASLIGGGRVDLVLVGADRIAANGDVANKVGTYGLALAAAHHGVPFVVVAPLSTVDVDTAHGGDIPIEQRPDDEVAVVGDRRIVPAGTSVANPAFDVTPASLVTAWVTEAGVFREPGGLAAAAGASPGRDASG